MNRERKESCSQVTDERGSKGGRGVGGRYQPTRTCKISGRDLTARDSCSLIWCSLSAYALPFKLQPAKCRCHIKAQLQPDLRGHRDGGFVLKPPRQMGRTARPSEKPTTTARLFICAIRSHTPSETEDKNFGFPKDRCCGTREFHTFPNAENTCWARTGDFNVYRKHRKRVQLLTLLPPIRIRISYQRTGHSTILNLVVVQFINILWPQ